MVQLSSSAPPDAFFGMFIGIWAFAMLLSLAIMAGCGYAGYYVAKKYDQPVWMGILLGVFMHAMGVVVMWLIGYTSQQNKERQQREQEYARWWYATYGGQTPQAGVPYASRPERENAPHDRADA
jgi:hypothetical protein